MQMYIVFKLLMHHFVAQTDLTRFLCNH